jgi:AAA15 family ATPase/GTPase
MQLIIKNLGSIETGEIDLSKKFYVFVGYNNSGKTYVSQLLWAIFNEESIKKFSESANLEELNLADGNRFEINQNLIDNLLHQFAVFLTDKVILDTFNVPSEHFILGEFSMAFKCDVAEISHYQWKSTAKNQVEDGEFLTFSKEKGSLTINVEKQYFGNPPINVKATLGDDKPINGCVMALVEFALRLLLNSTQMPVFLPSTRLIYLAFYQYFFRLENEKKQPSG